MWGKVWEDGWLPSKYCSTWVNALMQWWKCKQICWNTWWQILHWNYTQRLKLQKKVSSLLNVKSKDNKIIQMNARDANSNAKSNLQIKFDQCYWLKRAKVGKKSEFVNANKIICSKRCGISKCWPTKGECNQIHQIRAALCSWRSYWNIKCLMNCNEADSKV